VEWVALMAMLATGLTLEQFLTGFTGEFLGFTLAVLIHTLLVFHVFGVSPAFFIWLERKVSGRIQDRLGPTRVGGKFGWLQSVADGIKLIQKEDLAPAAADKWLFRLAPYLALVASFTVFMVLPFSRGWAAVVIESSVFLALAIISLEVLGIILAGWSSGSKWALFGSMREAAQMVSYEIPLALCALIPVMVAGSLNFVTIAEVQAGFFLTNWLIFHDPFTFIAFFVYFTVAIASVKRAPFDLAEAESELVAGFHTEYSGMRWSYFFLAEYASMLAVSCVAVLLFLGGWWSGTGLETLLEPLRSWGRDFPVQGFSLGNYVINLFGAHVFLLKAGLLVTVQIWVRWTLPRLRIDQVMSTCLKYLIPISCALFLGASLWPLTITSLTGRPLLFGEPFGDRVLRAAAHQEGAISTPTTPLAMEQEAGR
jgi:NADH-quinone oxidoreductase subunit H